MHGVAKQTRWVILCVRTLQSATLRWMEQSQHRHHDYKPIGQQLLRGSQSQYVWQPQHKHEQHLQCRMRYKYQTKLALGRSQAVATEIIV
jgi:hypothetical protein